ncbi:sodium-dependent glucose transporter 1A-like isoform X2 [Dermacentor andersoni]|nr:sodium-dependent glucose transporter 1A-like isoform X2 [Dermacentor andersoni]XP_054931557.1 sodium-dependent glucose transporter 1A-like isoform X2 [Dermacentor andersoni]XP_054931558.1 sodium-dependent glucose transporter 1A-like isoform X2 [Dermacentor andersoni]XP_054931559.1 sodium-dependent glucose transporter 1A-like isoform X2 [Dermacentor andersoni]
MLSPRAQLWLKLGRTCNLSLGCLGMGLILALTGVALLDLVEIYDSDISSVSHLITARCVGGLLGSLLGGKLYDTCNVQTMSILMMVLACVTVLMIPLSGSLPLAFVMVFFGGISSGAFDTGANVWIINLWPENSSPALQVFHLAFGVGCMVAPLIAEPFLSTGHVGSLLNQTGTNLSEYLILNDTGYSPSEPLTGREGSRVYYAFGIASAFHLALVVAMVALYLIDDADTKPPQEGNVTVGCRKESPENVRFSRTMLALLSAYVCVYVALECTSSQMLTAFAVKSELHLSKSAASRVAAVYFFCFAASRLAAALVTVKLSPFQMLVLSHVIIAVTAAVFLVWGSSNSAVLWACSALTGVGQGPVYAAAVAWTVAYVNMSNKMMSVVIITAGIGALSPPLLVGQFLDHSPNLFLYVCFVAVLLCVAFFVAMHFYVRKRPILNADKEVCVNGTYEKPLEMLSL